MGREGEAASIQSSFLFFPAVVVACILVVVVLGVATVFCGEFEFVRTGIVYKV